MDEVVVAAIVVETIVVVEVVVVIVVINGLVLRAVVEVKSVKDVVVGWVKDVFDIRDDEVVKYKGLTPLIPKKKQIIS